jgi:hypothetical protein
MALAQAVANAALRLQSLGAAGTYIQVSDQISVLEVNLQNEKAAPVHQVASDLRYVDFYTLSNAAQRVAGHGDQC